MYLFLWQSPLQHSTIYSLDSTKVPFILSHAHHAHVLHDFPYTVLPQSFLLGFGSLTTAFIPPSHPQFCLEPLFFSIVPFLLRFTLYLARAECFLHADHYCIPLHPYVSLRLICTLQHFTGLVFIPSLGGHPSWFPLVPSDWGIWASPPGD